MAITKVWIEEGCVACNLSAENCPEVFDRPDPTLPTVVRPGADYAKHEQQIKLAAQVCPVQVIKFEET